MTCPAMPQLFLKSAVAAFLIAAPACLSAASAQEEKTTDSAENIAFSADVIDYDSNVDIVTAKGNVVVKREGYTLQADTVVWNCNTGEVTASGNIRSIGPRGDVAYGDSIQVTDLAQRRRC